MQMSFFPKISWKATQKLDYIVADEGWIERTNIYTDEGARSTSWCLC
jgi:hypothetical protein